MNKRWVVNKLANTEDVKRLTAELSIKADTQKSPWQEPLSALLIQRGIHTKNEAETFFRPSLQDIHNPYLMKDMDKAVQRVEKAINDKENILIFGDYDVDGTSAVALMYSFLKKHINEGSKIEYYVPDRYLEGYGISQLSIEYAHENNFSLIIVLDCGIKCHKEIALANTYNIDVIICDHHLPDETLPSAYAILDPKREDCNYPYKELTGCGVGFKLVQAIAQNKNIDIKELEEYFDLLAISIASDVVPITGENRILSHFGLRLINKGPRTGIESLLAYGKILRKTDISLPPKKSVFTREITINDLVFCVGPRINAAGRMDTGRNSVHLLISQKEEKTSELGRRVEENNSERRELDSKTTKEAIAMVKNDTLYTNKRSIVVYNPQWSKGVVGIVASRLVEHFYRPSIVLTLSNGLVTGSARSVRNFDLHDALCKCSHLLEHFGGHTFAAGLSIKPENVNTFIDFFEKIVTEDISEDSIRPTIDIDVEISLHDITKSLYDRVLRFAPFGPQNMSPIFMTKNVLDDGNVRIVGENHLKLSLYQLDARSYPISAIGFGLGEHYDKIAAGQSFHICYHIDMNEWQGRTYIQLIIKDIKFEFDEKDII